MRVSCILQRCDRVFGDPDGCVTVIPIFTYFLAMRFRLPRNYWASEENRRKHLKDLELDLGISHPVQWKDIPRRRVLQTSRG